MDLMSKPSAQATLVSSTSSTSTPQSLGYSNSLTATSAKLDQSGNASICTNFSQQAPAAHPSAHSTIHSSTSTHSQQQSHSSAGFLSLTQQQQLQQFESSLNEIYKYKTHISQKIRQLENLIGRLKSIVLIYDNEFNCNNSGQAMNTTGQPKHIGNKADIQKNPNLAQNKSNREQMAVNLSMTKASPTAAIVNNSTSSINGPNTNSSMDELRTILADIDAHLAVLKDIEDRHAMICEEYSKEIRVRDDTITTKAEQISYMNHELMGLQSQINHLTAKNQQLEAEIVYIKSNSTSLANTEVSTTPSNTDATYSQEQTMTERLFNLADQGYSSLEHSKNLVHSQIDKLEDQNTMKLDQIKSYITSNQIDMESTNNSSNSLDSECSIRLKDSRGRLECDLSKTLNTHNAFDAKQNYPDVANRLAAENSNEPMIVDNKSGQNTGIGPAKPSQDKNYEQLYHELAAQYKNLETLIFNKQSPLEESKNANNRSTQSPKPMIPTINNTTNSTPIEKSLIIDMNKMNNSKALDNDDNNNAESIVDEQAKKKSPIISSEYRTFDKPKDTKMEAATDAHDETDGNLTQTNELDGLPFVNDMASDVEDEDEPPFVNETMTSDNADPLDGNIADTNLLDETLKEAEIILTQQTFEHFEQQATGEQNDVVATSIKAYEHFVKMQHDLETLMKNEEKYKNKIEEFKKENETLRQAKDDEEFKLSEVQYELDILKHNYNLEIESFSTAVNERESLIEKLQEKVESLKKRFLTLDEKFRNCIEKEVQYKSTIEEFEGRLNYEQMQKQTVIDSRVHDLEKKLNDTEAEFQVEINNLRTDLACKISIEKELQTRIEELESTIRANGMADGYEEEFGYYKSQIDSFVKELETEKQDKQRLVDKYEDELRLKDKQYDHLRDQARKDKDAMLRDKNEIDQKLRKLMSKFKVKEREILSLQEKLQVLNDKFHKNRPLNNNNNNNVNSKANQDESHDDGQESRYKCEEQMMTEMALNEAKMFELKAKLEDTEERLIQINGDLSKERNRRRELETYYLGSINHRYNPIQSHGRLDNRQDDWNSSSSSELGWTNSGHRNSTSSLALLMDENDKDLRDTSLYSSLTRSVRQQKNILLFGGPNAKIIRVGFLLYLVLLHYFAVEYYLT